MSAPNPRQEPFRVAFTDHRGRPIEPTVRAAAEVIGPRAIQYACRFIGDPALAANLLEEAAATVSRVVRRNRDPIVALESYLFRAFIRLVSRAKRSESAFVSSRGLPHEGSDTETDIESRILVGELLARCDPTIRDMFIRRIQGFSWKEIAKDYGVSAHAAESRYSQALRRLGRKLRLRA
jgi:DNA-directed RNA polymerase specialized sigma24 family protein